MRVCARWLPHEDVAIREQYPDYAALMQRLPHRSYNALKYRARLLGLTPTRNRWTAADRHFLLNKTSDPKAAGEIRARFPHLEWNTIRARGSDFGCIFPRAESRRVKEPAIVAIRTAAKRAGITLVQLDRLLGDTLYFGKANSKVVPKRIAMAARLLGGDVTIRWDADT